MLGTSINDSFVAALHVYGTKMWNLRIRNYSRKMLTNMEDHYISSEKTLYMKDIIFLWMHMKVHSKKLRNTTANWRGKGRFIFNLQKGGLSIAI